MSDPIIKRGMTRSVVGVEVSELEVKMFVNSDVEVLGQPLAKFAREGGFDGAVLELNRDFAADWESASCGSLNMFVGRIAEVTITGTEVTVNVKSMLELLNIQMPRNIYSASCSRTLYDAGCTLSAATLTDTITAGVDCTRFIVNADSNRAAGYYELGTIESTSGLNFGTTRSIKRFVDIGGGVGAFTVGLPWPYFPEAGDEFIVKPGCDHLQTTCAGKFDNLANFRGFPFIPTPESTI